MRQGEQRSSALIRGSVLVLLFAGAAWELTFVGPPRPAANSAATQRHGYRIDWMIEGKNGEKGLQTQDGYFVGEKGFEKSQAAQGLRYRMRPTAQEYIDGTEVDGLRQQFGPIKIKFGEIFGGTANNKALRDLKRKIAKEGITDAKKLEENKYWLARYGHKRWFEPYVDQSQGLGKTFLRGLAAWSACDPLGEERGKTWIEADYGKPWLNKYIGTKQPGWVTEDQVKKEYDSGKLLGPTPAKK